jgi:hypothetical protein
MIATAMSEVLVQDISLLWLVQRKQKRMLVQRPYKQQ